MNTNISCFRFLPSLKYCDTAIDEEDSVLLRVMRLISPSLLITSTSSAELLPDIFRDDVVVVIESVNCLGVSDPVFDLVRILLVSIPEEQ